MNICKFKRGQYVRFILKEGTRTSSLTYTYLGTDKGECIIQWGTSIFYIEPALLELDPASPF